MGSQYQNKRNYSDSNTYGNSRNGRDSRYGVSVQDVKLPNQYLSGGYYLDAQKEQLNKRYIVDYPREIADSLGYDGKDMNKRSQIRKYYEYVLRVRGKLRIKNGDFECVRSDLLELIPYVTYAESRGVVSKRFVEFITANLNVIHDTKDFYAFVKHFEAIIAFMKKD